MPKDYSMAPFFATIDTVIMGRKTLDASLQAGGGSFVNSSMATYVFSRSKPPAERDGLVLINQSPATFNRQLRKRPGKNIWIWLMGGSCLPKSRPGR
jgi:dihydrofolate reductase